MSACQKDEYFGPVYLETTDSTEVSKDDRYLLVGCEGNFQLGNASLSIIDLDSSIAENNAYEKVNSRPIGDVLQSFKIVNEFIYVVVNNSGTVKKLTKSLREVGEVQGLVSPRYLELYNNHLVVSDLYANKLSVIDTHSLEIIAEIELDGWSERFARFHDRLVVEVVDKRQLVEILPDWSIGRIISLSFEPSFIVPWNFGLIACGNYSDKNSAVILKFNEKLDPLDSLVFQQKMVGADLMGDSLFLLTNSRVAQVNTENFFEVASLDHRAHNAYGIFAHRDFGVFICDAKDYLSNGEVIRLDLTLTGKIESFSVGIIPQSLGLVD